jgi:hypothetical protein
VTKNVWESSMRKWSDWNSSELHSFYIQNLRILEKDYNFIQNEISIIKGYNTELRNANSRIKNDKSYTIDEAKKRIDENNNAIKNNLLAIDEKNNTSQNFLDIIKQNENEIKSLENQRKLLEEKSIDIARDMSISMDKSGSLELAKYLTSVWITSWVLTTKSWWGNPITWWKKEDWSFFMIGSGNYYEWKDPKELRAQYLAREWILDWKVLIADENGKVIWIIKTDLEEELQRSASSLWTLNSLKYANNIAEHGFKSIANWHKANIDINTNSTQADYTFGYWSKQFWGFYKKIKDINYADLTSLWVFWDLTMWRRKSTLWALRVWAQFSHNTIEWQNWNKGDYYGLSLNSRYSNEFFSNKTTDFWVWAVVQGQIIQDIKNGQTYDSTLSFWISWVLDHKISQQLKWNINFWYWGEGWSTIFGKKSLGAWLQYTKNNLYTISWKINYESWLWHNKKWWNISLKLRDTTVSAWYEKTYNSGNTFLSDQAKREFSLKYDLSNVLSFYLSSETTDNWSSENTNTSIWVEAKF